MAPSASRWFASAACSVGFKPYRRHSATKSWRDQASGIENCTSMGGSILACSANRALTRSSAAPAASRSPAVPPPAISASILRNFARSSSSLATATPNIRHEQAIPPAAARPTNIQGAVATTLTDAPGAPSPRPDPSERSYEPRMSTRPFLHRPSIREPALSPPTAELGKVGMGQRLRLKE